MSCDARQFSEFFFRELAARNIPYVVADPKAELKGAHLRMEFSAAAADLEKLPRIQIELARKHGWALVRTAKARRVACDSVLVNLENHVESLWLSARAEKSVAPGERISTTATGFCFAVLGSDGAGKSTLLRRLQELLRPVFPEQETLHFRPAVFERKSTGVVRDPHGRPPRGVISSWLKVGYYLFDFWAGWWLKVRPWRVQGRLVIFDRSFDDLLVDQTRYRLQKTLTLVRSLRGLVPGIERTIILTAPAEVLHRRKPELTVEELARQQRCLEALAQSGPNYRLVAADAPAEEVAQTVWRDLVTFLAKREERAHE
jgi:thymidylate kinase